MEFIQLKLVDESDDLSQDQGEGMLEDKGKGKGKGKGKTSRTKGMEKPVDVSHDPFQGEGEQNVKKAEHEEPCLGQRTSTDPVMQMQTSTAEASPQLFEKDQAILQYSINIEDVSELVDILNSQHNQ